MPQTTTGVASNPERQPRASVECIPCVAFLLLIAFSSSWAQSTDTIVSPINQKRLRTVIIGSAVAYAGSMAVLSQAWYSQNPSQSFHWFNDAAEWKQVDKCGHFYSAFQLSSIGSRSLQWANMPRTKSDRIAAITSFAVMSSIEVFDGFSAGYGASATDLLANAVGAGFYLGQGAVWNEVRIYPKFSYHSTSFASQNPDLLGSTPAERLLKDYNGQTYWLSVDMDKFIRFPKWLNLSAGYGADNMIQAQDSENMAAGYTPYRQYYLGLDFDLTAFRSRSKFWNSVIYFVNMIRLPAPALEFSQGKVKGHWLYF